MIDSHCHLADEAFEADREAVIARARAAGLTSALCVLLAGDDREAARAGHVRSAWADVLFSAGVHPHRAARIGGGPAAPDELVRDWISRWRACAVGEIGLDYHYDFSPRDVQREVFRAQVALARELRLPVVIHTREAADDTFDVLREEGRGDLRGVFHCFTGDAAMARRAVDLGFHVSFAGIVTFPRAVELREAAAIVPADRLLAETDAPYLAPVPHRGRRNEPAFVARVYDVLAEIRRVPREELVAGIARNFASLFGEPR